jgi:CrcB protein
MMPWPTAGALSFWEGDGMKGVLLRCLAIGVAGFVGAVTRYLVALLFGRLNIRFPLGTLFINVTGSLFLGWFLTYVGTRDVSDLTRLAIATGFVGAYTTFSTFMYESNRLVDEGAGIESIMNLLGSLVIGLFAVRVGIFLARWS